MTTADRDPTCEARDADLVRATERERVQALVTGDLDRAARLHTDYFQLINPLGGAVSKEQYLGGIGSGQIRDPLGGRFDRGPSLWRRRHDSVPVGAGNRGTGAAHRATAILDTDLL